VAAEGWAKVVSVSSAVVALTAGSTGVAPELVGSPALGAAAMVVAAGSLPTVGSVVAVVAVVAAGSTAAGAVACVAAAFAAVAAASASAIMTAPPSVADTLIPAMVIFDASAVFGRRLGRMSAARLQSQYEHRHRRSEYRCQADHPCRDATGSCPHGGRRGFSSMHGSPSAGR
jgi:hypothetical protein